MSEELLDHDLAKELRSLVEKLTTTGALTLDPQPMKELKKICKKSDLYVERAYRLLMTCLSEEHAEIRLSTFQIMDELFNRSHFFRELLVSDFHIFLELTVETDQHNKPLPPPKAAANRLKTDVVRTIQQWQDKYGSSYKKLALGYKYLKTCRHVNFSDIVARTLAEQRRVQQQEQRKQKALAAKLGKVRKEFSELQKEIADTAMEAESCIELLLPKPNDLFTESDFAGEGGSSSIGANRAHSRPDHPASSSQRTAGSSTGGGDSSLSKSASKGDINRPSNSTGVQSESSGAVSVLSSSNGTDMHSVSSGTSSASTSSCDKPVCGADLQGKECESAALDNPGPDSNKPAGSSDQLGDATDQACVSPNTQPDHPRSGSDESDDDDDDDDEDFEGMDGDEAEELGMVQTHGLGNRKYNLQIEIETGEVQLTETEDNRDLFHSLKDASCLVSLRYLPHVVRWLEVLGKTGGSHGEIKSMIDLKLRLENIKAKCAELRVVPDPTDQEQSSDSDEEMEEVPEKEGYEPVIPAHMRAEYGLDPASASRSKSPSATGGSTPGKRRHHASEEGAGPSGVAGKKKTTNLWNLNQLNKAASVQDPTSRAANLVRLGLTDDARPSTSKEMPATATSGSEVPVLPYGTDLAYWGTPEMIEVPLVQKNDSLHRFWVPAEVEHEKPSQNDIAAVMNRSFHYTGQFVPVKWKCRAKMPSGKLCERMDRVKCPFHGKIIPRNEDGSPSNPEDFKKEAREMAHTVKAEPKADSETHEVPPWLDAELQADIEAATGHDLGSKRSKAQNSKAKGAKGKGKGKGKKDKHEGLTNIKKSRNTTRARLEAKVFKKGALRRVASALDAADYNRVRDKFGSQFNYSIKN